MNTAIRWSSKTQRIDTLTGEILTKHQATGKQSIYRHYKTESYVEINRNRTRGIKNYILHYIRKEQLRLEL